MGIWITTDSHAGQGVNPVNQNIQQNPNNNNISQQRTQHDRYTGPNQETYGLDFSFCDRMEHWQREVVSSLNHGKDIYVIAAPGGGKTLPIFCHWTNNILGLDTMKNGQPLSPVYRQNMLKIFTDRDDIEKIFFLVPIRQLAMQTEKEVMQIFGDLFSQALQRFFIPQALINPRLNPEQLQIIRALSSHSLERIYNELISIQDRLTNPATNNQYEDQVILRQYNEYKNQFKQEFITVLNDFIYNKLIRVKTGDYSHGDNNALVHIAIYESAPYIYKAVNNIGLLIVDESHQLQKSGDGIDLAADQQKERNAEAFYDVLKNIKRNTNVVLLSGTEHPESAKDLVEYLNLAFDRNFDTDITKAVVVSQSRNRSQLEVVPDDSLMDNSALVNIIVNAVKRNDWGQLIVIFSSKTINNVCLEAIKRLGPQNLGSVNNNVQYGMKFTSSLPDNKNYVGQNHQTNMYIDRNDRNKIGSLPTVMMGAQNIKNPLLRECVSRGFGFVYRKDQAGDLDDSDKNIVADLFKQKKISAMLGTDAVGIGINIDVKSIYIPRIEKFTAGQNVQLSLRDLAQLLHRAGRGNTPIATIYTPLENIPTVQKALNAVATDFNVVPKFIRKSVPGYLLNSLQVFKMYITSFIGV